MEPFYLGLSCLSNVRPHDVRHHDNTGGGADRAGNGGNGRALHNEGRRVLGLLDAEMSGSAREPSGQALVLAAIATESGGRPFFVDRHADFNISHSRHVAAVAWSEAANPASGLPLRVGCDVQHVSPGKNREAVARKYYTPGENSYIDAAGNTAEQERIERFYRIWVLKECYLKAKGLSVLDIRTSPSFAERDGLVKEVPVPFGFFLYELDSGSDGRYLLAVCRETGLPAPAPPPEIRRYSPVPALKQTAVIEAG
jgi:hypothetical protein